VTTRIDFYHLLHLPLDKALPKLLEKALSAGLRAVVMAGSRERVAHLDDLLWTYDPASFLPHGTRRLGSAERQPVWLTEEDENPNGATVLIMIDNAVSARMDQFDRCLLLFDGRDPEALQAARQRWSEWKAAGYLLVYNQQTESGGWTEKARTGE